MPHQVRLAKQLSKGFGATITDDPVKQADVHIVLGPHYAKQYWLGHKHTILLDRCYYKGDPEHISLGWMDSLGGIEYCIGEGQPPVEIQQHKGIGSIFLADYNGSVELNHDAVRFHPTQSKNQPPLTEQLKNYQTAIGYRTTALVTAGLMGLDVITRDETFIMNYTNWNEILPYVDWHETQLESGEAWEFLKCQRF